MTQRHAQTVILFATVLLPSLRTFAADDLDARGNLSAAFSHSELCVLPNTPQILTLRDAIERAICFDPVARDAWAKVRIAAADQIISRSAYLPNIQASADNNFSHSTTSSPNQPEFNQNAKYRNPREQLSMALTIFDFGLRHALNIDAAETLASARATHSDALRKVVIITTRSYFEVIRAESSVVTNKYSARLLGELRDIAENRFRGGAALITEQLQAAAAYEEAVYKVVESEGDVQSARGTLASITRVEPQSSFQIVDDDNISLTQISDSYESLVEVALQGDPKVAAAAADLRGAEASFLAENVRYHPTVELDSSLSFQRQEFNKNPTVALFQNGTNNKTSEKKIGLKITIPISSTWTHIDRMNSAKATILAKQANLDLAIQQASLEVWTQFHRINTAEKALQAAEKMVYLNKELVESTKERYEAGAASIVDALSSQNDLASAQIKRFNTLLDLRIARLSLLSCIGEIDYDKP